MSNAAKFESNDLSYFKRFLPKGGVCVYPEVIYVDVNDIPELDRIETKRFFGSDESYMELYAHRKLIYKGSLIGKRFCAYVFKEREAIGNIVFTEILDNPHGYGEGDFHFHKWIYPKFRNNKYSRYAISDLIHMLFIANVAKNLYVYTPGKPEIEGRSFWDALDYKLACMGAHYASDGPEVQKYILLNKKFETDWRPYYLLEFNGDIYRGMDLKKYFMAAPGRTLEVVERWIKEMDKAAEEMRKAVFGPI